jgi:hypothetical protein
MPDKRYQDEGFRQRFKRFVGGSGSGSRSSRDRILDPEESASTTSKPSGAAASEVDSVVRPIPSLAPIAVTPSGGQSPARTSSTRARTTPGESASSQNRFGLFPIIKALSAEDLSQNGPDIVAIHGINGDYIRTWTHPEGALWLRDFLPGDIPVPARVFSFSYDAQVNFSLSKARLEDFARSLLQALNRIRRGKVCSICSTVLVEGNTIILIAKFC